MNVKQILLYLVKDHLICHIAGKKTAKKMYDVIQECEIIQEDALQEHAHHYSHEKESYLMKKEDLRDQIVAVKDTIDENELVQISLNGFSTLWHNFF